MGCRVRSFSSCRDGGFVLEGLRDFEGDGDAVSKGEARGEDDKEVHAMASGLLAKAQSNKGE